jgi:endonuclease YncB( thermonuclease family)
MTHRLRTGLIITLMFSAAISVRAQAPPPGSGPVHFEGFIRVIDGDTFEVYINGHQTGIGIIGIKAPMGNTSCGIEATNALWGVMSGGGITLEDDAELAYDSRKRRMYYVVLPDGASAAVKMAQTGLVLPTGQGRERDQITAASAAAAKERCAHR